jgi:hypothetical protein
MVARTWPTGGRADARSTRSGGEVRSLAKPGYLPVPVRADRLRRCSSAHPEDDFDFEPVSDVEDALALVPCTQAARPGPELLGQLGRGLPHDLRPERHDTPSRCAVGPGRRSCRGRGHLRAPPRHGVGLRGPVMGPPSRAPPHGVQSGLAAVLAPSRGRLGPICSARAPPRRACRHWRTWDANKQIN